MHQQNLIRFKQIMTDSSAVIFISLRGLNHGQLMTFCIEIESECGDTVYYGDVRWLSIGEVLQRFLSPLEEIKMFLNETEQPASHFENAS
jgi:hypothetical protein